MKNHNLFLAIVAISSIIILIFEELSEFQTSILMCVNFLVVLYCLWKINKFSPLFIFYLVFSFLFIGGRFWAELFDESHYLWKGTFFYDYNVDYNRQKTLLTFILAFSYMLYWGYKIGYNKRVQESITVLSEVSQIKMNGILKTSFYILGPLSLFTSTGALIEALQGGYLTLYESQNSEFSGGAGLLNTLQLVFFGLSWTYGDSNIKRNYMILYIINAFILIIIGTRGTFGALLLFLLWLYYKRTNANVLKILSYGVLSLSVLLVVFHFSIRAENMGNNNDGLNTIVSNFFYDQGISLMVFDSSRDLDYPWIPYFNSFIPGSATIYRLVSGDTFPSYEATFAAYVSHTLNPSLFENGNGLGWTFLGDLYLFSGKNIILFTILSGLFGYLWGRVEKKSYYLPIYRIILFATFLKLLVLPRAGLNTFFTVIVYAVVIHFLLTVYIQASYKKVR